MGQIFNNYWTRLSKTSWFASDQQIKNNWSARHWQITIFCDNQCNNNLAFGWYRFRGTAGTQMPTKCVGQNRCSSQAPGWWNASHPLVEDGIVTAKVGFHWTSGCCTWSTNIRVRNCGGFYAYELRRPPACSLRYCGNGRCKYRYSNNLRTQI